MKKMKGIVVFLLSLTLVLGTTNFSMAETSLPHGADVKVDEKISSEALAMTEDGDFVKDEVIAVFRGSTSDSAIDKAADKKELQVNRITDSMESEKIAIVDIEGKDSVEEAITKLSKDPSVLYAQPNYKYKMNASGKDPYDNNEPMNQWYLENIKAREAWKTMKEWNAATGNNLKKTRVAAIDSGVDLNHKDLQANLNKSLCLQSDHKGGFLPLKGDKDSHGTHVSGIIAATYYNKVGISGIASGSGNNAAELMMIDPTVSYDEELYFDTFDVVDAIMKAEEQGAKVINMSFGANGWRDRVMEDAAAEVYKKGTTLVAAAGNDNSDDIDSPSDFGEVIGVCNTTKENERDAGMFGSNFGIAKDISAPGTNIKSTVPGDRYDNYSGTSMSSPAVAAVASMVLSVNPDLSPGQVKNILCATANGTIGTNKGGFDPETGYGLVNADAAVRAAISASSSTVPSSITLKEHRVRMNNLDTHMLETLMLPAESLTDITWSVEAGSEDIVSVDEYGKVKSLKPGTAKVTATAGSQTDSCTIYVNDTFMVEEIKITNQSDVEKISVGDSVYLDTQVLPIDAEDKSLYWKSEDKKIATVAQDGFLEGKGAGSTTIRAYSYNGVEASFTVKVYPQIKGVTITKKPSSDKLKLGSKFKFAAVPSPDTVLDKGIKWSSSNQTVARIDKYGNLTTRKPGKTSIIATAANGRYRSVRITIFSTKQSKSSYGLKIKTASTRAKLSWRSIPNADGYEIYRRDNAKGSYKKIKTVKNNIRSYTNRKLRNGKRYSYKVRAFYIKDGKKYVCSFSSTKTVTPKR